MTAVTRATCWSVRQCDQRAAALDAKADTVVKDLDALIDDLGLDVAAGRADAHQAAVTLVSQLLELVEHLQANLRYGMALPPTPTAPAVAAPPPTPPVTYLQPIAQPPSYKPPPVDPNVQLLDRAAAAARCRLSIQGFDLQRREGRVPPPCKHEGRTPLWHPEQLVHVRNTNPRAGKRS